MFVSGNLPSQMIKWLCLILAVSSLAFILVSGFFWYGNDRSGKGVYQHSRGAVKEDITREIHPGKFREMQVKLLFQIGVSGILGVIGFRFFKKLDE